MFVHRYYPAEMRDAKTPADVRDFGVHRAMAAFNEMLRKVREAHR